MNILHVRSLTKRIITTPSAMPSFLKRINCPPRVEHKSFSTFSNIKSHTVSIPSNKYKIIPTYPQISEQLVHHPRFHNNQILCQNIPKNSIKLRHFSSNSDNKFANTHQNKLNGVLLSSSIINMDQVWFTAIFLLFILFLVWLLTASMEMTDLDIYVLH
mgnify:CR=1 FL=1